MKIGPAAPVRPHPSPGRAAAPPSTRTFSEVLRETGPTPAAPPSPSPAAPAPAPSPVGRGLARALEGALAGEKRVDAILQAAARGKTFTAAELLAMQATVFRYSQTIEVLSRATDRLVGAVKQTLGTPV
jgi:hypothetical protein